MFFAVSFNPEKNLTVAHNFYKRHHRLQWRLWVEVANDSFQWQQASFKHSTAGWKKTTHGWQSTIYYFVMLGYVLNHSLSVGLSGRANGRGVTAQNRFRRKR